MICHKSIYNSRHTYATMLLMDGVNSIFVANQLGHSLQMLIKRYAKWIHGEQNRIEISKLNTTVALNKVPFLYLKLRHRINTITSKLRQKKPLNISY